MCRASWLLAALGGGLLAARPAVGLQPRDNFNSYGVGNLDGTQAAGTDWRDGWRPKFNDVAGVHHLAGVACIDHDNPIGGGGPCLRLIGAGPKSGGGGNGAARALAGPPASGGLALQFDLRVDSLNGLSAQGDAINIYVNGVESSGLSAGHNVSAWLAYRPDWLSGSGPGFDDANWLIRNGHPYDESIAPGEWQRWIDTGVAVREGAVYTIALALDLDADTWSLTIAEAGEPVATWRVFTDLSFFEVTNRATLAANQVVFALWEGSDETSAAAISIDNIGPPTVPEPATVLLMAAGAIFLTHRRRRALAAARSRVPRCSAFPPAAAFRSTVCRSSAIESSGDPRRPALTVDGRRKMKAKS